MKKFFHKDKPQTDAKLLKLVVRISRIKDLPKHNIFKWKALGAIRQEFRVNNS